MKVILLVVLLALAGVSSDTAEAHPGNTASDGAHYCWTNCDYWGETYGERHYHGGGYTEPSGPTYYEQGQTNGALHANSNNREYIVSVAKQKGAVDGGYDGANGTFTSSDSDICDEEVVFDSPQPDAYSKSFQSSYASACRAVYNDAYDLAYDNAYTTSANRKQESIPTASDISTDESDSSDYTGWLIAGGLVASYTGIGVISGNWEAIKKWWNGI